jgi:hypothetical protein
MLPAAIATSHPQAGGIGGPGRGGKIAEGEGAAGPGAGLFEVGGSGNARGKGGRCKESTWARHHVRSGAHANGAYLRDQQHMPQFLLRSRRAQRNIVHETMQIQLVRLVSFLF